MFPIISPPEWITGIVSHLSLSYHQAKHAARYTTGLIVSKSKTIKSICSQFMDGLSDKSTNRFMTEYHWDTEKFNTERLTELQSHDETRWSCQGVGIIDDTILEKTGEKIPFAGTFWDNAKERFVYGQNIVSLHYADKKTNYPVDYRLYEKEEQSKSFKTKIGLAKELIEYAISAGMPCLTYIHDAWYTCKELADFIESKKKFWIGSCKSDLLVKVGEKFMTIKEYADSLPKNAFYEFDVEGKKFLVKTKKLYFQSLERKARLIICKDGEDVLYLATNRYDFVVRVLSAYLKRGKIDAFYKDAKQNLGLDKCQLRNIEGIKRHWYLVFFAHGLMKLDVAGSVLEAHSAPSTIGQNAKRTCIGLIKDLLSAALRGGNIMEKVDAMSARI